jgi:hypothetical protein
LTGYILPKELQDFWYMNSVTDARTAQTQARFFKIPFPYTSALFLSMPAKIAAQEAISKGSGRVLGGGVCSEEQLLDSLKMDLSDLYAPASADWICFENGFMVESQSYSTGFVDFTDIKEIEVIKKGIKFIFSLTAMDAITRIHFKNRKEKFIDIQCNAMGMSALRQIMKACM